MPTMTMYVVKVIDNNDYNDYYNNYNDYNNNNDYRDSALDLDLFFLSWHAAKSIY